MGNKLKVSSETGALQKVIVHRPDKGIEVVTPKNALEFLYDDIVYLPRMSDEHKTFTRILSTFLGKKNVLDSQSLLNKIVKENSQARANLIQAVCELENCDRTTRKKLKELSPTQLVFTLYTGILKKEKKSVFAPLPNYVFTRDIAVVVNDHIVICQASKKARTRESLITRSIIYNHPLFVSSFNEDKIIDLTEEGDEVTLEGGDVMVLDENHLLVGFSERTSEQAIDLLKEKLFSKGVIDNVVKVTIPQERTCMHIDTLFTQISGNEFVVFAPYVMDKEKVTVRCYARSGEVDDFPTLPDFIKSVNPEARFIKCGNGEYPYDEREQWTDGCNLVAIKDGVAVAYQRNYKTAQALKRNGYTIVDAKTFLRAVKRGILNPGEVAKTIITIPSTELSRARGGPHCMTFPISRV